MRLELVIRAEQYFLSYSIMLARMPELVDYVCILGVREPVWPVQVLHYGLVNPLRAESADVHISDELAVRVDVPERIP